MGFGTPKGTLLVRRGVLLWTAPIMEETNMANEKKPKRNYASGIRYEDKPEQVKNRMARNRARYAALKAGKVHKGDGKDVAHVVALDKGGTNKDGVRIESASKNRSFKRDSKSNLVSETSKRERKKI